MAEFASNPENWVALAFLVFVVLAGGKIFKASAAGIDKRIEGIRQEIQQAENLREEAQHTLAEYRRKQREAVNDAKAIVEHAKEEAERMKAKAAEDLAAAMTRREKSAEEKIAQAESRAILEVRRQAADIAVAAATQVLSEKLDTSKAGALIDQTIEELPQRLN